MKLNPQTLERLKAELPDMLSKIVEHPDSGDTLECSFCTGYASSKLSPSGYYTLYGVEAKHDDDCLGVRLLTELEST